MSRFVICDADDMPDGLIFYDDFIDKKEEQVLLTELKSQKWATIGDRKVQHYYYQYNYITKRLTPTQKPPEQLKQTLEKINVHTGLGLEQCIVNSYTNAQGIAAHTDAKCFDNVCSLSLGENTEMIFRKGKQVFRYYLKRRSLLILTGASRWEWTHEIAKSKTYRKGKKRITKGSDYLRISITGRELVP